MWRSWRDKGREYVANFEEGWTWSVIYGYRMGGGLSLTYPLSTHCKTVKWFWDLYAGLSFICHLGQLLILDLCLDHLMIFVSRPLSSQTSLITPMHFLASSPISNRSIVIQTPLPWDYLKPLYHHTSLSSGSEEETNSNYFGDGVACLLVYKKTRIKKLCKLKK